MKRSTSRLPASLLRRLRSTRRLTLTLASFAALAVTVRPAPSLAATYTYTPTTPGNIDNWSAGTNWTPGAPVSNAATELNFVAPTVTATGTYTSNNDNGGNFLLNILDLTGASSATTGVATTFNITGNPLEFTLNGALAPVVNLTATSSGGTLTYNVSNNLVLDTGITFQGAGTAGFNFSGIVSGASSLTKTGTSALTLNANNTYSGGTFVTGANGTGSSFTTPVTRSILQTNLIGGTAAAPSTPFGAANTTIAVANGTLGFGNNSLTSGQNIYVGGYNLALQGGNSIRVNAGTGASNTSTVTFAINNLTLPTDTNGTGAHGSLILFPTNTGTATAPVAGLLGTREVVTVANGAPTPANGILSAAFTDGTTANFLTYDATKGFTDGSGYMTTFTGAGVNSVVSITSTTTPTATPGNISVYGVRVVGYGSGSGGFNNVSNSTSRDTLTIGAGGLITQYLTGGNFNIYNNLNFGSTEGSWAVYGSAMAGGYTGTFNGNISGTGGLAKYGPGQLYFNSAFSLTGGLTIADGSVNYGNGGSLPSSNSLTILRAGTLALASHSATYSSLSGDGAITNGGNTTFTIAGGTSTGTTTFSGSMSGGATGSLFNVAKTGATTQNFTGANPFVGTTAVTNGTVNFSGAGTFSGTTAVTVSQSATLNLDNTAGNLADRINTAATLTVSGGAFNLLGAASAASTQSMGNLTLGAGPSAITLTPGTGGSASLTFVSLAARSSGNVTIYSGAGLGTAAVGTANTSNVSFSTALSPTATGVFAATAGTGATVGNTSAPVLRGGLVNNGTTTGFATYDTNGVRLLNPTTEQTATYAAGTTNVRLDLATGTTTITGGTTNTLQLNNTTGSAAILSNGTGTALLAQNGFLFTGNSAISLTSGTITQTASTGDLLMLSTNTAGVTLNAALASTSNGDITFGGTGSFTLNGTINAGTGVVRFETAGTSVLSKAVTGTTAINVGTLQLATGASFSSNLNVNVAAGATLDLNNTAITLYALGNSGGLGGTVTNSGGTAVNLTIGNGNNGTAAFYGTIAGSLNLIKAGTGTETLGTGTPTGTFLAAQNTYTGTTTINAGILTTNVLADGGSASGIGQSSNAAANLVLNGGTLQFIGGTASTDRLFTLGTSNGSLDSSGGTVTFSNTGAVAFSTANAAHTLTLTGTSTGLNTFASLIADDGTGLTALTKSGTGTWLVTGTNTYTGITTVSAGTLNVAALANGGTASSIGQSSNAAANLVLNGGTFQYTGATAASTDRLLTLGATAGSTLDASGAGALAFTGTGTVAFSSAVSHTLTFTGTSTAANSFAPVLADSGAGLTLVTKTGAGTWTLSGANTYTGATTVTAGTLAVTTLANGGTASGIGASDNSANNLFLNGGTLQYVGTGAASTDRNFNLTASSGLDASGGGALTWNGSDTTTAASTLTLTGTNTGANTFAGTLSNNTAVLTVAKTGTGTWVLSNAANSYTGTTTVTQGTLVAGADAPSGAAGAFGTATSAISVGSTTTTSTGDAALLTGGAFTVARPITVNTLGTGGTQTATLGTSADANSTFSGTVALGRTTNLTSATTGTNAVSFTGILSGTGGITKVGTGAVTLAGTAANTFTGVTIVNAGTLNASASGALGATTALTVNTGGTLLLGGAGALDRVRNASGITLAGGTFSNGGAGVLEGTGATRAGGANTGGTNAVGLGMLTLTVNSTLSFAGTSGTLVFSSFAPGSFTLNVTGTNFGTSMDSADGTTDRLIFNQDVASLLSNITFNGAGGASEINLGGSFYEVIAAPVPEPSTMLIGVLLCGVLIWRRARVVRRQA